MATDAKHRYVVMMDIDPDQEWLLNDLYDNEHIPVCLCQHVTIEYVPHWALQ